MMQKEQREKRLTKANIRLSALLLFFSFAFHLSASDWAGALDTDPTRSLTPWTVFTFSPTVPSDHQEGPFAFNSGETFLDVTDTGISGDRYEVYDFGSLIGTTTIPTDGDDCGPVSETCFGDYRLSTAVIPLEAGAHSITFRVILAPTGEAPGPGFWRLRDLIPAGEAPPTTIITHGFQLSGTGPPAWTYWLARALVNRAGSGRILVYQKELGRLAQCDQSVHSACDFIPTGGLVAVIYDWVTDSNNTGDGWSETAGEALAATLLRTGMNKPQLVDLDQLHFIGHSRGTVVNSEAMERLIETGWSHPVQVTTLDPHDNGGFPLALEAELSESPENLQGGWDDLDVNELHPDYLCGDPPGSPSGICSWENSGFHDNYRRTGIPPSGRPIPGTADFDMNGLFPWLGHSDVHYWYYFTVDTDATSHPDGSTPESSWWNSSGTCPVSGTREDALPRAVDGYNLSQFLGGAGNRCEEEGSKQPVLFDFFLSEGIVNGDFEKDGSSGQDIPGWTEHGMGGPGTFSTEGQNGFLNLQGGEWREHNHQWVPETASHLSFCRRVNQAGGQAETLAISLITERLTATQFQSEILHQEVLSATSDWECFQSPVAGLGEMAAIRVELIGGDSGVEIDVDQFQWIFESNEIFVDGFESGDTSAWSSSAN